MSTASLVETLDRFLLGKPSWLGTAAELIEAFYDEMGIVIDDPRSPWKAMFAAKMLLATGTYAHRARIARVFKHCGINAHVLRKIVRERGQ